MHVFKLAALAAVLFTTAAHAAVDCARPLSAYGYRMAEKYPIYQAYRADFDAAFTQFCKAGKQYAANGMPYEAVNQRTGIEAARWMRERFADDIPAGAVRSGLESLVYMSGWSGYTGEAWPPEPAAARPAPKKRTGQAQEPDKKRAHFYQSNNIDTSRAEVKAYADKLYNRMQELTKAARAKHPGAWCYVMASTATIPPGVYSSFRTDGGQDPNDKAFCADVEKAIKGQKMPGMPSEVVINAMPSLTYELTPN